MEPKKRGYYAYFDDKKQKYYYLDTESLTTTWIYPTNGIVLDPNTLERFPNPNERTRAMTIVKQPKVSIIGATKGSPNHGRPLFIEVDKKVQEFVPPAQNSTRKKSRTVSNPHSRNLLLTPQEVDEPHYLPKSISENIHKFIFRDFAIEHFQRVKERRVFKRTTVSIESLISFQSKPLTSPLLLSLPEQYRKDAIRCFNLILSYTGGCGKPPVMSAADELVQILYLKEPLIDEVYFQMMKQVQENPNYECLILTYHLFLIVATIFPSTMNSETWIKSFISQKFNEFDPSILKLVQIIYIRFHGRCCIGKPLTGMHGTQINQIPQNYMNSSTSFNVSLFEIMWNQRIPLPKLPIPLILYKIIDLLIRKGCFHHTGIFRISGNIKEVEKMVTLANNGCVLPVDGQIDDIASLLKMWVRDLADPLVPYLMFEELIKVSPGKNYLDFVNKLPKAHRLTLAYLIGFLKDLSKYEEDTKMSDSNLAIVFGPNVVQTKDTVLYGKKIVDIGQNFVLFLMRNWDVSSIYPLNLKDYE